ncbi:hypothetical protein CKSOR_00352 [Candidatus Kinetoplastibacterium sorsogonicusi]|uniref:Uncharacterized protein n=1 Tax=Candidatus Kinetoplastidibacterium kentomonadis TaxID=1576550 RepID=A0A3Q8ETP8_9PROT|nr:Mth938-like domain-containing protein [Candidatus Kinetoplastibacterium sorsogonicusi]AWD32470.1 hypothetical protein CKSOR_00352 [Candidatus Kinetoplastibacterium sorsogonicusi]
MLHFVHDNKDIKNKFNSYGDGYIEINNKKYFHPITFNINSNIKTWNIENIQNISISQLWESCNIINNNDYPELLIIGTGRKQEYISRNLITPLLNKGIGVEIMSTVTAIYTYTLISDNDKNISIGILPFN